MHYPLKWFHEMGRELRCMVLGHDWKHSPTRRSPYFDMDEHEVPYAYRKGVGRRNYMFESIASWRYKCSRCRVRMDDAYDSVHINFYRGVRYGFIRGIVLFDLSEFPMWRKILFGIPFVVCHGLVLFWCYFDRAPLFPLTLFGKLEAWFYSKLDPVETEDGTVTA